MNQEDLIILGIALGLGLLAGLQREYSDNRVAGIRTFSLVSLFGAISGMVARHFENVWLIAFGLMALTILLVMSNYMKTKEKLQDIGQTTEVSILLMYVLCSYLVLGEKTIAIVVGAMLAVLLHMKKSLADFTDKLAEKDMRAIFQFVAISLIVLPILPNTAFGPYGVLKLREIWMMVVLIVGLSVAGYFAYKWMGKGAGTVMNGILGGLISSTATTLTYARRSKEKPELARLAAFVIVIASTIAFIRVIVEVAIVTPQNLGIIAPPLAAMAVSMALLSAGLFFFKKEKDTKDIPEPDNPAQFKSALFFALLYAIILVAVAFAKDLFGDKGLYAVSFISGLTDVDAITLSLSNTVNAGNLEASTAWKLILTASLSNLVFKGGMAAFIGDAKLRNLLAITFGGALLAGLAILWLWPD